MTEQQTLFSPPPNGHEFKDGLRLEEFIKAGKAIFTLYSHKTTKHFTYKVVAKSVGLWFVSRKAPNNSWVYLGAIHEEPVGFTFTKATTPNAMLSDQFLVFSWFWRLLQKHKSIHRDLSVYHEGRCGTCGTPLTDPQSIALGYGPECRRKKFRRPAQP